MTPTDRLSGFGTGLATISDSGARVPRGRNQLYSDIRAVLINLVSVAWLPETVLDGSASRIRAISKRDRSSFTVDGWRSVRCSARWWPAGRAEVIRTDVVLAQRIRPQRADSGLW